MPAIKEFWVDGNNLTGEIPDEIGDLSTLTSFKASHTAMTKSSASGGLLCLSPNPGLERALETFQSQCMSNQM